MNVERLNKLRKILIEHHDNGILFDLNYWSAVRKKGNTSIYFNSIKDMMEGENECKTVCCACGLYALKYPEDELEIKFIYGYGNKLMNFPQDINELKKMEYSSFDTYTGLVYKDKVGINAASAFFDIPSNIAEKLFYPQCYIGVTDVSPLMVVERIDHLLSGKLAGWPHS